MLLEGTVNFSLFITLKLLNGITTCEELPLVTCEECLAYSKNNFHGCIGRLFEMLVIMNCHF